jgi:hypothetical protein
VDCAVVRRFSRRSGAEVLFVMFSRLEQRLISREHARLAALNGSRRDLK